LRRQRFIQLYTNYYVFYNITILVQRSIGCQVGVQHTYNCTIQVNVKLNRRQLLPDRMSSLDRKQHTVTSCNRKCLNQMYEYGARKIYSKTKYTVWMNYVELGTLYKSTVHDNLLNVLRKFKQCI